MYRIRIWRTWEENSSSSWPKWSTCWARASVRLASSSRSSRRANVSCGELHMGLKVTLDSRKSTLHNKFLHSPYTYLYIYISILSRTSCYSTKLSSNVEWSLEISLIDLYVFWLLLHLVELRLAPRLGRCPLRAGGVALRGELQKLLLQVLFIRS